MFTRLTFRAKTSMTMVLVLCCFGISLAIVISRTASSALVEESKRLGVSGALHVNARIGDPLLAMDFLRMKDVIDEVMRSEPDIAYLFIQSPDGIPLVHTFQGGFPMDLMKVNAVRDQAPYRVQLLTTGKELFHDFAVPVMIGSNRLGTVRLGVSHKRIGGVVDRLLWTILLISGLAILLTAILGSLVWGNASRRIEALRRSAEEIVKGNLDVHTSSPSLQPCWVVRDCGKHECPAYGRRDRRCWYTEGTLCSGCIQGPYADKIDGCRECTVFRISSGDEIHQLADYFDFMALTLKGRLEDLQNTQRDLERQRHLFRTIIDVTPDLLILQDPATRCLAVNKAFCSFYGLQEESVLGSSCVMHSSELEAEQERAENVQVMSAGVPLQVERQMHGVSSDRWFHVVKTPVLDSAGHAIGLLCNARDITTFRELQARMNQSQKLESLGQLAAGVAHEINTPLGIILGYTQLLLDDFAPESETYETLKTVEKHTRICKKIVADLLRFSRNTQIDKKPVNLNDVIEHVASVVEHTFRLEHIAIERRLAPGLPQIFGDSEKLQQVFMNLLNNAYDSIASNGTVTVFTERDPLRNEVVARVTDTGSGIPPEVRDKIFDPFFTTKSVGHGTGLGLAVTFGIIQDHGGQIEVESHTEGQVQVGGGETTMDTPKTGTTFTLRFPVFADSAPAPDDALGPLTAS